MKKFIYRSTLADYEKRFHNQNVNSGRDIRTAEDEENVFNDKNAITLEDIILRCFNK